MSAPRSWRAMSLDEAADRLASGYADSLRVLALSGGPNTALTLAPLAWSYTGGLCRCVPCAVPVVVLARSMRCPECGASCKRPVFG